MVIRLLKSGYERVKTALSHTGSLLGEGVRRIFKGKVDEGALDDLEELLYEADLGVKTTMELVEKVRTLLKQQPSLDGEAVLEVIREELLTILEKAAQTPQVEAPAGTPHITLIIGVNGNGKTTSIAKIAKKEKEAGKQVLLAAADTFRAAAVEQLNTWAERLDVEIVKGRSQADPAAVAFDAVIAAQARNKDRVFIDTAGRLHTKKALMEELAKIRRSCSKVIPGSPHETLLVVDASTGQNAIDQAETFNKFAPITGLVLTKLDGSAKGGVVIAIQRKLGIPVKYLGVGEGMDDLQPFDAESFITALLQQ